MNTTETNRLYRLVYKTNIDDAVWTSAGSWIYGAGNSRELQDANAVNHRRFYAIESVDPFGP